MAYKPTRPSIAIPTASGNVEQLPSLPLPFLFLKKMPVDFPAVIVGGLNVVRARGDACGNRFIVNKL